MPNAPRFKIYTPEGKYSAACKHAEDAAVLVAHFGDGATIRDGHKRSAIMWREGSEHGSAADSFDFVARTVELRARRKCAVVGANNQGGRVLCELDADHGGDHDGEPV